MAVLAFKNGKALVTLTQNMIYGLHITAAAYLYENPDAGDYDDVKELYEALPHRMSLDYMSWNGEFRYLKGGSKRVKVEPRLLMTLVTMIRKCSSGAWPQGSALATRANAIEELSALFILGIQADGESSVGNNSPG